MSKMSIDEILSRPIGKTDINYIINHLIPENREVKQKLWEIFTQNSEELTTSNALWVMTHLVNTETIWLHEHQPEIIEMLLTDKKTSRKRMLLQLLKHQEFVKQSLPVDLLDFCLSKINAECEPYAIRCFSLYTAFNICRHYNELIAELQQHVEILQYQVLSPGLSSALRQIRYKIARLKFD